MSSNIRIPKVCQYCGKTFIAKTTVTKYCSPNCGKRGHKIRVKNAAVDKAIEETNRVKLLSLSELNLELIKQKEFLSIKETCALIGASRMTIYRLIKSGDLIANKLGSRTIIKRSEIDKLFQS